MLKTQMHVEDREVYTSLIMLEKQNILLKTKRKRFEMYELHVHLKGTTNTIEKNFCVCVCEGGNDKRMSI